MPDFEEDLARGKECEDFCERWFHGEFVKWSDGRQGDFIQTSTGRVAEFKCDFYNPRKTPNFFMEKWSDIHSRSPGGVWQSKKHGAHWFVYVYWETLDSYWFTVDSLLSEMDKILGLQTAPPLELVPNKSWVTGGYLIPRTDLCHLFTKVTLHGEFYDPRVHPLPIGTIDKIGVRV